MDPDRWTDEGELTELPEIPVVGEERVFWETSMDPVNLKIIAGPDLEIPMILDDPEKMAVREEIHERIQVEIYHVDRERAFQAEEILDIPPEWNKVKDLILDDRDILSENMIPEKRRRDEIFRGRRKRRKEDDIYLGRKTRTFSYCILEDAKS